jgi:HAD superfamily hydrolase (TIGR01509 family)
LKYAAVIFDMDGVLADSEPVYYAAMNAVVAELGKEVTPELQASVMGHGVAESWAAVAEALAIEGPLDDLVARYDRTLCRLLAEIHEPLPGVRELITSLRASNVPLGLASSSWPDWIDALLDGIGLGGAFDAIASATMVDRGKPAPDIYLLAAKRLSIAPARCIAIEDTPTGLAAAKAAGMFTIQVRSASTAFPPLPDADLVIETLVDFDMNQLAEAEEGTR